MVVAVSNVREPESEEKPQKSLNEKQQVSCFYMLANDLFNWLVNYQGNKNMHGRMRNSFFLIWSVKFECLWSS